MARRRELAKLPIRIVGLSTALANAGDVAEWIGVSESALFKQVQFLFLRRPILASDQV